MLTSELLQQLESPPEIYSPERLPYPYVEHVSSLLYGGSNEDACQYEDR